MKKILFLSWDGPETNYVQSLFMPIFVKLQEKHGHQFHIIQFTWGDPERIERTRDLCHKNEIPYKAITVFRKHAGLGVLKAVKFQSKEVQKYIITNNIDIVMPRATTSAAIVNHIHKKIKATYLFDADGFSQDERVDFRGWDSLGLKYRIYRDIEFKSLHLANRILVRSHQAKKILSARAGAGFPMNKIHVITNGKDADVYDIKEEEKVNSKGVNLIYVGSLGGKYDLENMLKIFMKIYGANPHSTFSILTGNVEIAKCETNALAPEIKNNIFIKRVNAEEVPTYINKADIALAFIKPLFSVKGVAPIKIAEYLLCGMPIITNHGIGDNDLYLQNQQAVLLVNKLNKNEMSQVLEWSLQVKDNLEARKNARKLGLKFFDINNTVEAYQSAIENL